MPRFIAVGREFVAPDTLPKVHVFQDEAESELSFKQKLSEKLAQQGVAIHVEDFQIVDTEELRHAT